MHHAGIAPDEIARQACLVVGTHQPIGPYEIRTHLCDRDLPCNPRMLLSSPTAAKLLDCAAFLLGGVLLRALGILSERDAEVYTCNEAHILCKHCLHDSGPETLPQPAFCAIYSLIML